MLCFVLLSVGTDKQAAKTPQTGDNRASMVWAVFALLSLAVVTYIVEKKHKVF